MPTYDYLCESCGYEFERFQPITAKPIRKCPKCGKAGVQRLIGAGAGVIFKGSGFYQTDYRSEGYKQAAESEKKTTDKDAAKKDKDTKAEDTTTSAKSTSSDKDKKKSA